MQLKTEDFVKLMITQLQQQDPTAPAKSDQLLSQMSQIGQLQSSTQLQDSLKGLVQQNQIGAAADALADAGRALASGHDPHVFAQVNCHVARAYQLSDEEFAHVLGTFPLIDQAERAAMLREYRRV